MQLHTMQRMRVTFIKVHRAGFLCSLIFISYIAMASSMTLDLTELRNKISKIKLNPRGNLWATGHFMGKKSVVDSSYFESSFGDLDIPVRVHPVDPLDKAQDLREAIIQELKMILQARQKQEDDIQAEEHVNQLLQD